MWEPEERKKGNKNLGKKRDSTETLKYTPKMRSLDVEATDKSPKQNKTEKKQSLRFPSPSRKTDLFLGLVFLMIRMTRIKKI